MIDAPRYLASFGAAFVVTLLLTPLAARLAQRIGALDHPSGHKTHTSVTPYLGGLAVMGGLVLVGALAAGTNGQLLTILACAVLGFLRSNFPPAKIFLGDAGSMLLGFLVAALTLHVDLATNSVVTRLV